MNCPYCKKGIAVKNGHDRKNKQRYKCRSCTRTFSEDTIFSPKIQSRMRLAMYLILSGCKIKDIAEVLRFRQEEIVRWRKLYLKNTGKLVRMKPTQPVKELLKQFRWTESGRKASDSKYPKKLRKRRF